MSKTKQVAKATENTEIVQVENQEVSHRPMAINPEALIEKAIMKGLPVETMERLLAMRKELKAEFAKEQYDIAMANFQRECPVIKKETLVKDKYGKDRYSYSKLDSIVSQTKDIIGKNGFSYKIETEIDEKFFTANCIVTHKDGHKEVSPFKVPIGNEEFMTEVQKFGARATFAKRYAFCNAFGIMTGDEDNDAVLKSKKKQEATSVEEKMEMILKVLAKNTEPDKIIEVDNKVQASQEFSAEFKKQVHEIASKRVDELTVN